MHLAKSQRCRLHFIDMLSLHYRFQMSMLSVWGSKIFFLGTLITWHRYRLTLKESTILVVEDKGVVACFRLSESREDEKEKGTRKYECVIALS